MAAFRSWIAPILIQALDERLEAADSRSLYVEDDLSNLYIHCDSSELVRLVELRPSPVSWVTDSLWLRGGN